MHGYQHRVQILGEVKTSLGIGGLCFHTVQCVHVGTSFWYTNDEVLPETESPFSVHVWFHGLVNIATALLGYRSFSEPALEGHGLQ